MKKKVGEPSTVVSAFKIIDCSSAFTGTGSTGSTDNTDVLCLFIDRMMGLMIKNFNDYFTGSKFKLVNKR